MRPLFLLCLLTLVGCGDPPTDPCAVRDTVQVSSTLQPNRCYYIDGRNP
jgi:hypothetical protein